MESDVGDDDVDNSDNPVNEINEFSPEIETGEAYTIAPSKEIEEAQQMFLHLYRIGGRLTLQTRTSRPSMKRSA